MTMTQVVKAASKEEIAKAEARQQEAAAQQAKRDAAALLGLPEFVTGAGFEREHSVPLLYPFTYDGVYHDKVVIRRPLMREWRAYLRECQDAVAKNGPGADDYVDQVWLSVPAIVLENMDFTDASSVEAASEGFFARSRSDQALLQQGLTLEELEILKAAEAEQAEMGSEEDSTSTSTAGEPSP